MLWRSILPVHGYAIPREHKLEESQVRCKSLESPEFENYLNSREREFFFEKLHDSELMFMDIAREEVENPADPESQLGQIVNKV